MLIVHVDFPLEDLKKVRVAVVKDAYDKACMDKADRKPQSNSTSLVCLPEKGARILAANYAKQTMLFTNKFAP